MDTQENAILCRLCASFALFAVNFAHKQLHIVSSEHGIQIFNVNTWSCTFFFQIQFFIFFFCSQLRWCWYFFVLRNLICMSPLNQTKGTHIFDANRFLPVCVNCCRCEWQDRGWLAGWFTCLNVQCDYTLLCSICS